MSGASGSGAAAGFDSDGSRDDKQMPQRISVEEVRLWEGKRKNTRETEDDRLIFRDKCPCRPPRIQLGVGGILFALHGEK